MWSPAVAADAAAAADVELTCDDRRQAASTRARPRTDTRHA